MVNYLIIIIIMLICSQIEIIFTYIGNTYKLKVKYRLQNGWMAAKLIITSNLIKHERKFQ